ncbi:MAG: hypothetical protein ACI33M_13765 [Lysinibacillus sp.]
MPNNKEFNTNFMKQFLQNEENNAAKLAIISAALITLGEGISTLSDALALEGKQSENFDGTDAITLAVIGGSIQTFGDIVATIAAVRAIEELQTLNKNRNNDNNANANKIKELERENKYLKAELNKLRKQKK